MPRQLPRSASLISSLVFSQWGWLRICLAWLHLSAWFVCKIPPIISAITNISTSLLAPKAIFLVWWMIVALHCPTLDKSTEFRICLKNQQIKYPSVRGIKQQEIFWPRMGRIRKHVLRLYLKIWMMSRKLQSRTEHGKREERLPKAGQSRTNVSGYCDDVRQHKNRFWQETTTTPTTIEYGISCQFPTPIISQAASHPGEIYHSDACDPVPRSCTRASTCSQSVPFLIQQGVSCLLYIHLTFYKQLGAAHFSLSFTVHGCERIY